MSLKVPGDNCKVLSAVTKSLDPAQTRQLFQFTSASTNLPEVKMEKHLGCCCLEFRSSFPHALGSFRSH